MLSLAQNTRIFLHVPATDLRKSFEGLSDLVTHQFKEDPLSGHLYVFANRRRNRIKLLYFDGSGTWVCAKRLGEGCCPAGRGVLAGVRFNSPGGGRLIWLQSGEVPASVNP